MDNNESENKPSLHIPVEDPDKWNSLKWTGGIFAVLGGGVAIGHYIFHWF